MESSRRNTFQNLNQRVLWDYMFICVQNSNGKLVELTDIKGSYRTCIKVVRQTKPFLSGTGDSSDKGNHYYILKDSDADDK